MNTLRQFLQDAQSEDLKYIETLQETDVGDAYETKMVDRQRSHQRGFAKLVTQLYAEGKLSLSDKARTKEMYDDLAKFANDCCGDKDKMEYEKLFEDAWGEIETDKPVTLTVNVIGKNVQFKFTKQYPATTTLDDLRRDIAQRSGVEYVPIKVAERIKIVQKGRFISGTHTTLADAKMDERVFATLPVLETASAVAAETVPVVDISSAATVIAAPASAPASAPAPAPAPSTQAVMPWDVPSSGATTAVAFANETRPFAAEQVPPAVQQGFTFPIVSESKGFVADSSGSVSAQQGWVQQRLEAMTKAIEERNEQEKKRAEERKKLDAELLEVQRLRQKELQAQRVADQTALQGALQSGSRFEGGAYRETFDRIVACDTTYKRVKRQDVEPFRKWWSEQYERWKQLVKYDDALTIAQSAAVSADKFKAQAIVDVGTAMDDAMKEYMMRIVKFEATHRDVDTNSPRIVKCLFSYYPSNTAQIAKLTSMSSTFLNAMTRGSGVVPHADVLFEAPRPGLLPDKMSYDVGAPVIMDVNSPEPPYKPMYISEYEDLPRSTGSRVYTLAVMRLNGLPVVAQQKSASSAKTGPQLPARFMKGGLRKRERVDGVDQSGATEGRVTTQPAATPPPEARKLQPVSALVPVARVPTLARGTLAARSTARVAASSRAHVAPAHVPTPSGGSVVCPTYCVKVSQSKGMYTSNCNGHVNIFADPALMPSGKSEIDMFCLTNTVMQNGRPLDVFFEDDDPTQRLRPFITLSAGGKLFNIRLRFETIGKKNEWYNAYVAKYGKPYE